VGKRRLRLLAVLGIVVLAVLTVSASAKVIGGRDDSTSGGAISTTIGPPSQTTGFVRRNGRELTVDGKPWRFVGYNLPCANPFVLDEAALGLYLDTISRPRGPTSSERGSSRRTAVRRTGPRSTESSRR
jgi:hypothetical protein